MKKLIVPIIVILFSAIFIFSCKKTEIDYSTSTPELPDLQTQVSTSASGFITNENNDPVQGAVVKLGASSTTTDLEGYFEFSAVQVLKNAAMILVEQPGYFKAIRCFTTEDGNAAFVRIKLLQKTIAGNIDAILGGSINLSNGLMITIPANAVVEQSSGAAYNGNISVYARWTDPGSEEFIQSLPGGNRGLDKDGYMKSLNSYALSSVELIGDAGQALQIAAGKKATLVIPINSTVQTTAPATIPLWHLDESTGLWEEEGEASKSGSTYVAEVSHFSFWNCSWPANPVGFYIKVLDSDGHPVPFAFVKLTDITDPGNCGGAFTGPDGIAFGVVPANTDFRLTISTGYGCSTPVYDQQVQTGNGLTMGNVTLPADAIATVSGTVLDCSMQPVNRGFVSMNYEGMYSRYNISQAGPFSFTTLLCGVGVAAHYIASDAANMQESNPISFNIHPGANDMGNIQACGINTMEYVNYTINGTSTNTATPYGAFSMGYYGSLGASFFQGSDTTHNASSNSGSSISFGYQYAGSALGSSQPLKVFWFQEDHLPVADSFTISTPVNVHITQYDNPGGFIAGNFAGTLIGKPPANLPYVVSVNFKIRRSF